MEKFLQYAWQHKLFPAEGLKDTAGNPLRVLSPGWINRDAGPDFFNAKIIIGSQEWVGNVEMHINASDWYRHEHHRNPAYDSVILHVVEHADREVTRPDGAKIPQLELAVTHQMEQFQRELEQTGATELPCLNTISTLPRIYLTDWITALGYERIYAKTDRLETLLDATGSNWEEACYITLARALGFGKNSEQFQRLARSLPLAFLRKHRDSLTALEAMLMGQAGLLTEIPADNPYAVMLQREYLFYARKFSLDPPDIQWQTGRMRPHNLPHRRLALLAAIIHSHTNIFSRIINAADLSGYREIFQVTLSPFWSSNFSFNTSNPPVDKPSSSLTDSSINSLIINAVVPILHSYGTLYNNPLLRERAIELLEAIPPERNAPVNLLRTAGLPCTNAFESQAAIQLRREYCETRKCLRCRIGLRKFRQSL
ncbi:MAG: DUF2851 family protein [Muribaculaceae bacterium]|nr:DUF2851 family protein [Muribaculaceae bacterium]